MPHPNPKVEEWIKANEKDYPLIRLWNELDEEMIQAAFARGAKATPWQTDDVALKDVWNRLTDPRNMAALESENQRKGLNAAAREARERALSECKARAARK